MGNISTLNASLLISPLTINSENLSSIPELFEMCCKKYAEKPALQCMGDVLTYADLEKQSRSFAAFLQQDLKLKKGERIGMLMPTTNQHVIALLGAQRAGLITVGINPLYTPREFMAQVNDAGVETLVMFGQALPLIKACLDKTPIKRIIISSADNIQGITIPVIFFQDVMLKGKALQLEKIEFHRDDAAILQYTGGTTGIPKAAIWTQGTILAQIEQCYILSQKERMNIDDQYVILTISPLYHGAGLMHILAEARNGAFMVLIPDPRNIAELVRLLSEVRPHSFVCVTTILNALMHFPGIENIDFSRAHALTCVGMPLPLDLAKKWKAMTHVNIRSSYGLSEASGGVASDPPDLPEYKGSCGIPFPATQISIRNNNGDIVPLGEEGEIWVKGPQVIAGYWNNPEATKEVIMADGWLKTGDIGRVDAEGFLYMIDRKKDMMKVSGFNVYPFEIEEIIARYPGVKEVGVISVDDEYSGQVPKAFIVTDQTIKAEDIIDYCREQLVRYKVPRYIEFISELPKSAVGKILRRELRK